MIKVKPCYCSQWITSAWVKQSRMIWANGWHERVNISRKLDANINGAYYIWNDRHFRVIARDPIHKWWTYDPHLLNIWVMLRQPSCREMYEILVWSNNPKKLQSYKRIYNKKSMTFCEISAGFLCKGLDKSPLHNEPLHGQVIVSHNFPYKITHSCHNF